MDWEQLIQNPVVWIAAALVLLAIIVLIVLLVRRRRRSDRLQRRYGAEYQRTVEARGSRREAERDLDVRRRHREQMDVRPLSAHERDEYRARFEEIQSSFVDSPEAALRSADNLIDEVAATRGYREAGGASRLSMVSVDQPEDTAVHRRGMARLRGDQRVGTEDMRQALLAARRLLERLANEGEEDEAVAPPPPQSLLGLDEGENGERERDEHGRNGRPASRADVPADDRSAPRGDAGAGRPADEYEDRTYATRPDDQGRHPEETIDVTERERSREGSRDLRDVQ